MHAKIKIGDFMTVLAPSILAANWSMLQTELNNCLESEIEHIHFDIMDGNFVPNISFGEKLINDLQQDFSDLFFDAHLMVKNPLKYVGACADAGANAITFHIEEERFFYRSAEAIRARNMQVGLACNPKTPIAAIEDLLGNLDVVLVMSVEPGFGGQSFLPIALRKIAQLNEIRKKHSMDFRISVDGGVNAHNAKSIVDAGADVLVMGSAFFSLAQDEKRRLTKSVQGMQRT